VNFFQRVKAVFSKTYFEQYVHDFYAGNDLPDTLGRTSEQTALKYSAFFGCNRVLSETFASVTINEFKKDKKSGDREKTDETGLYPILRFAPNDETSRYNFQECLLTQINFGGNFLAERIMNGRKIAGLSQIPWQYYDIYRDNEDKKLKYRIIGNENNTVLERNQVLHIPGPSTNGIVGMSLLTYAASTIQLGQTYEKFGQNFFKNGALTSGIFETEGTLKDEAFNRLKKDLKKNYQGLVNAGVPMIAEDGLKYRPLNINPVDAELLTSKRFQIEDICRFFRVPPHLVQHLEKATFNNVEHLSLEFVMYTMLPHFRRVEDNINCQLLTPQQRAEGYFFEYNMASLLRGDQKTMAESFAKGIQWGWLSVNDVRRMLNLNQVEGGDEYLRPLNMVPIGDEPGQGGEGDNVKTMDKIKALLDEADKKGTV